MASTRTSTRQEFGWRKHQDIDLQSGKLAINAQGTMLVTQTQIQIMLWKHAKIENFRVNDINGWKDPLLCTCTAAVTTKPAEQHKPPLEPSDIWFCQGIHCPFYLACTLDIDVPFPGFSFSFCLPELRTLDYCNCCFQDVSPLFL
uniref:Uncharacterized protein n=1 Tax=Arundo donax TaxID=35708 RepID=A0A0A9GHJ1_ARUDO